MELPRLSIQTPRFPFAQNKLTTSFNYIVAGSGFGLTFMQGCPNRLAGRSMRAKTCHVFKSETEGGKVLHTSMEPGVIGKCLRPHMPIAKGPRFNYQTVLLVGDVGSQNLKSKLLSHVDDLYSVLKYRKLE